MFKKDSLQQFDNRLLRMMKPPQIKKKLPSFKKYLTKSLQNSPKRQQQRVFSPKPKKPPIDDYLIEKIQDLAPSKITKQFRKTQSRNWRIQTQKSQSNEQNTMKYEPLIEKFRKKSLQLARKSLITQNQIKKKSRKPRRKQIGFDIRQISWAERKWGLSDKKGKFSQKLHPICQVYQECADIFYKNKKKIPNPFQGFYQFAQ